MNINLKWKRFSYFLIPVFSILLSYFFYKLIPIDNFSEISIVSATASIQAFLWSSYLILIGIIYFRSRNTDGILILNMILMYILTLIISVNLSATAMSLKGTPLASGDIRGDLLGMVDFAQYAKENLWSGDLRASGDFYPPVYTTLIGNVARILNVNAIEIYKPAELILLIIGPIATYFIWKKLTPDWVALIISIYFAVTQNFYFYYWKFIPLFVLVPMLILLFNKAVAVENDKKTIIVDHFYGFFVGMLILTYFGNFWWAILLLMLLSVMTFFSENKEYIQKKQTIYYLSASLALIPPTIGSIMGFYISLLYLLILGLIIFNYLVDTYSKFSKYKNYLSASIIPISYLIAFLFLRTNDDWFEGDVASANPTLKSQFNLEGLDFLIILLFILLIIISLRITWYKNIAIYLIGFCTSALIMRYFIASRMQITNKVDLWPRSFELYSYAFSLIVILTILASIETIYQFIKANNYLQYIFNSKSNLIYLSAVVLFVIYGSLSNQIGDRIYGSMPINTFNGAWYAHKGCSNPHEDPMLAKVFESRPYIQDFLRENCWGKKWPLVPPAPTQE